MRSLTVCGVILVLLLTASGQVKKSEKRKMTFTITCVGSLYIDDTLGANPKDVGVCEGDTIDWSDSQGRQWTVDFGNKSPFKNGQTKFDQVNHKSDEGKQHDTLTVYTYEVTIGGHKVPDPHVVTGG